MTTVQNVHNANEEDEFILQQDPRPGPFTRKIAVLMRINGRIDLLLLSDVQGHTRFIPNVGDHIADGLSALIGSGVLSDASSIMVINHADASTIGLLPFSNMEQSVRVDRAFLKASSLIPENIEITGFLYDVRTGKLLSVD
jgi:carbonic anhydrase